MTLKFDSNDDGTFEFQDVPEGMLLQLHVLSQDDLLGTVGAFFIAVEGDEQAPITMMLESTFEVDVDLADESGEPIVNTGARVAPVVNGVNIWRAAQYPDVDETGRITVVGVLRGVAYRVETGPHIDRESNPPSTDETLVLVP